MCFSSSSSLSPRVLVTSPSMSCHSSPIPFISISPAPEENPTVEPFSPFSALSIPPSDQDAFRPSHLTPPTTPRSPKRSLSHLKPAAGKGLESQKFQDLLAASKQRKASGGSNQSVEFRKEIAKKAHKNGHCRSLRHRFIFNLRIYLIADRRARFLSTINRNIGTHTNLDFELQVNSTNYII